MVTLREIGAITRMNLRNLPRRLGPSLVVVIGIAGVVAVMLSVLAMATGFSRTINNTGRADRAIVLRGGSNSELTSTLGRDALAAILGAPGIRLDTRGKPLVSAETVMLVSLRKRGSNAKANVTLRGIGVSGLLVHPDIHIVSGRMLLPGKREMVVGTAAHTQFGGLEIGSRLAFRGADWIVVGQFASGGNAHESELLVDAETVLSSYRRTAFQSISVLLDSADSFGDFKAALTTDPRLEVQVMRETDYYASLSAQLTHLMTTVGYVVGGIMAFGAVFGALNTMYSAVSVRRVEIATLRALGFMPAGVVISVLAESLLLACLGGVLGATIAWGLFNNNVVNTLGSTFTQVVFRLAVTPQLMLIGVSWALCIGLVGGFFPARRAARLPVAKALRSL
jgi:putative ABC transport system permease protein